jgi:hypothetical protein
MTWSFTFMWPWIVTNFFIIKPTRCTNFPNLLRHETLHASGSSSAHHQELIHCTFGNVYVIQVWRQLSRRSICSCSKAVFKPVWHIPLPNAQWINSWWWAEELPETCRVSCRSKFGKLVHLVGFIIKKWRGVFWDNLKERETRVNVGISFISEFLITACRFVKLLSLTASPVSWKVPHHSQSQSSIVDFYQTRTPSPKAACVLNAYNDSPAVLCKMFWYSTCFLCCRKNSFVACQLSAPLKYTVFFTTTVKMPAKCSVPMAVAFKVVTFECKKFLEEIP